MINWYILSLSNFVFEAVRLDWLQILGLCLPAHFISTLSPLFQNLIRQISTITKRLHSVCGQKSPCDTMCGGEREKCWPCQHSHIGPSWAKFPEFSRLFHKFPNLKRSGRLHFKIPYSSRLSRRMQALFMFFLFIPSGLWLPNCSGKSVSSKCGTVHFIMWHYVQTLFHV